MRVWNIEQSELIPAVTENRKAQGMGFQILKVQHETLNSESGFIFQEGLNTLIIQAHP